jgi:DNA invertase Pin-like site-specific DNA recombinase
MERAIGIVRVSQRDDDTGHSPEVQARALLKQAQSDGFGLVPGDIWDENVDGNGRVRPASGGTSLDDRPKLKAAVEAIERREATVIVAERFDRLFRDLDVQREVIRRVEGAGGRLVTAAGKISHATAEAELHANLNGAIAQYTKRTAMERSWAAVEIAIEEGRVPWKSSTPGYDTDEDGRLVPNEQAPIVEEAFGMRARGATIAAVREYLRANGVARSYHGTTTLLKSRVVLGEIHFGAHTPNPAAHPAIVDRDTWKAVQRTTVSRGRRAKSERLLARLGILRCGTCGARMVVGTANRSSYWIYRCPPTGDCQQRVTISAEIAEKKVIEKVRAAIADDEGRASAEANFRDAEAALEAAEIALKNAIRSLAVVADEPETQSRLLELRQDRDRARTSRSTRRPAGRGRHQRSRRLGSPVLRRPSGVDPRHRRARRRHQGRTRRRARPRHPVRRVAGAPRRRGCAEPRRGRGRGAGSRCLPVLVVCPAPLLDRRLSRQSPVLARSGVA